MSTITQETSSMDIHLPPGLVLPGPNEPTDQFRAENFNRSDLSPTEVAKFGSFVTALIVLTASETGRISMMPLRQDIGALFRSGYGFTNDRLEDVYGGIRNFQAGIGFMPDKWMPPRDVVIGRLKWMARILPMDVLPDGQPQTIRSLARWGSQRNILPYKDGLDAALGPEKREIIYRIFGIEKPSTLRHYSVRETYKIGATTIEKHGQPPKKNEFNEELKDTLLYKAATIVGVHHGTLGKFWADFDFYPDAKWMSREEVLDFGVRLTIKNRGKPPTRAALRELSKRANSPTDVTVASHFNGSFNAFKKEARWHYRNHLEFMKTLRSEVGGISRDVSRLLRSAHSTNPNYIPIVQAHSHVIKKLSMTSPDASYVHGLLRDGFDLMDDRIYMMQVEDLKRSLTVLDITSAEELRFVLRFMPRISLDETMEAFDAVTLENMTLSA